MSESKEFYNFETVLSSVYGRIEELVNHLFPEAKKAGQSWNVGSLAGERGRSLSISGKVHNAGCYHDYSDPSIKGNAIGLWAEMKNCDYQTAGKELAQFLGVRPEQRLEIKKVRKPPQILEVNEGLTRRIIQFAETRKITERTLRDFRCASTGTEIVFNHWDEDENLVMQKFWSVDGQKRIRSNTDPVPVLFGKHLIDPIKTGGTLIITEGHWDAMSWYQMGYPAVSIPNGVSNEDWIAEDYGFLNQFSTIFLDFDDDQKGREAEQSARRRLGYERCKAIRYRFKDANEALQKGEPEVLAVAYREAEEAPIERILKPETAKESVRQSLNRTHVQRGVPFFLRSMSFEFRPHEMSLWFGWTSHGKSTILQNQIVFAAGLGEMAMIASFETKTDITMGAMLTQYTADPTIGSSSEYDAAYDDLFSKVLFFDSMLKSSPDELIATMTLAYKQLGIRTFVVDNIMTLDVDRQDNTAQADTADKFRVFVASYPIHLHMVAHPRKAAEDGVVKPPSVSQIRGASEWGDMPHNIFVVYRDVVKAERLSAMRDEHVAAEQIEEFRQSCPDGKIIVRKQRETGDLPLISYWFDSRTKRAWKVEEETFPYWFAPEPDLALDPAHQ